MGSVIEYNKCFLCLPAWCTRSRDISQSIEIGYDCRIPRCREPVVTERDYRQILERAATEELPSSYVPVDLAPHCFVLDGGRRVSDPRRETSSTVSLPAHVNMAEYGVVKSILDALHRVGVRVDGMMSTPAAAAGVLKAEESDAGTAVIDIGRRYSTAVFFEQGTPRYSSTWAGARLAVACQQPVPVRPRGLGAWDHPCAQQATIPLAAAMRVSLVSV